MENRKTLEIMNVGKKCRRAIFSMLRKFIPDYINSTGKYAPKSAYRHLFFIYFPKITLFVLKNTKKGGNDFFTAAHSALVGGVPCVIKLRGL